MANKGKKLHLCAECGRKRFCSVTVQGGWRQFVCSRGHLWSAEVGTVEKINLVLLNALLPEFQKMFAESPFLKYIKA